MSQNPPSRRSETRCSRPWSARAVRGADKHRSMSTWATDSIKSFSALKYLQDRLLSLDMQAFYPFVQDVKSFLDECSASGSALINLAHAYNTHIYVNTFLHFFCQHFLTSPPGRSTGRMNFIEFKESFRGRKEDNICKHQRWSVEWWSPSN